MCASRQDLVELPSPDEVQWVLRPLLNREGLDLTAAAGVPLAYNYGAIAPLAGAYKSLATASEVRTLREGHFPPIKKLCNPLRRSLMVGTSFSAVIPLRSRWWAERRSPPPPRRTTPSSTSSSRSRPAATTRAHAISSVASSLISRRVVWRAVWRAAWEAEVLSSSRPAATTRAPMATPPTPTATGPSWPALAGAPTRPARPPTTRRAAS